MTQPIRGVHHALVQVFGECDACTSAMARVDEALSREISKRVDDAVAGHLKLRCKLPRRWKTCIGLQSAIGDRRTQRVEQLSLERDRRRPIDVEMGRNEAACPLHSSMGGYRSSSLSIDVAAGLQLLQLTVKIRFRLVGRSGESSLHFLRRFPEVVSRGVDTGHAGACDPHIGMRLSVPLEKLQRLNR